MGHRGSHGPSPRGEPIVSFRHNRLTTQNSTTNEGGKWEVFSTWPGPIRWIRDHTGFRPGGTIPHRGSEVERARGRAEGRGVRRRRTVLGFRAPRCARERRRGTASSSASGRSTRLRLARSKPRCGPSAAAISRRNSAIVMLIRYPCWPFATAPGVRRPPCGCNRASPPFPRRSCPQRRPSGAFPC